MNMKKSLFLNTVMLCAFILLSCSKNKAGVLQVKDPEPVKEGFDLDEASLKAEGYTKIYEEHFSADFSKWNIWEGGAYNNELQLYQGKNMTIKDGNLIITAKKEEVKGRVVPEDNTLKSFAYTSGRIESKALFTPDDAHPKLRISARIQLPLGGGMWPAFWAYGNPWPTQGEIDIIEGLGGKYEYITNYFYGRQAGKSEVNNELSAKKIIATEDLTAQFHVYEVIWTKNSLVFMLDGKVVNTKSPSENGGTFIPEFFGKPQAIILNLAVGGDIFGPQGPGPIQPGSMYVDWVKVFR